MTLEYLGLIWLRFDRGCAVALYERNPRNGLGKPDVLGVSKAGYLYEIEIKRSMSDFRANARKYHLRDRYAGCADDWRANLYPKFYWFLVPNELAPKVLPMVPDWAGLLRNGAKDEPQTVYVVKSAPEHKDSRKLTIKEKIRLASCMANQILSFATRYNGECVTQFYHGWHDTFEEGMGI